MKTIIFATIFYACLLQLNAFTVHTSFNNIVNRPVIDKRYAPLHAIEVLTLDKLENHEEEGERMKASIAGWLDIEWMPQEIHQQMGQSAKLTYIRERELGENEIMGIMTEVVEDLVKDWAKYDKDAFVNAWDIGNYVADYLHTRLGVDECGCHAAIFDPDKEGN